MTDLWRGGGWGGDQRTVARAATDWGEGRVAAAINRTDGVCGGGVVVPSAAGCEPKHLLRLERWRCRRGLQKMDRLENDGGGSSRHERRVREGTGVNERASSTQLAPDAAEQILQAHRVQHPPSRHVRRLS